MKIPKKIKIGAHDVTIKFPHKFQERQDAFGFFNIGTNEIFITDVDSSGNPCSDTHIASTFLHEVLHVINRVYCCSRLGDNTSEEDMVEGLAQGLLQVIRDNNLDFLNTD